MEGLPGTGLTFNQASYATLAYSRPCRKSREATWRGLKTGRSQNAAGSGEGMCEFVEQPSHENYHGQITPVMVFWTLSRSKKPFRPSYSSAPRSAQPWLNARVGRGLGAGGWCRQWAGGGLENRRVTSAVVSITSSRQGWPISVQTVATEPMSDPVILQIDSTGVAPAHPRRSSLLP